MLPKPLHLAMKWSEKKKKKNQIEMRMIIMYHIFMINPHHAVGMANKITVLNGACSKSDNWYHFHPDEDQV